jgi:hypothetical protein
MSIRRAEFARRDVAISSRGATPSHLQQRQALPFAFAAPAM